MTREQYLASNLGRARSKINEASKQLDLIRARLFSLEVALTIGAGEARQAERARDAVQDLRIMLSDIEAFVGLHLTEEKKESA
jgi:hypothetical protein